MKTLYFKSKALFLGLALIWSFGAVAQSGGIVNDQCAGALTITCGGTVTGTTIGATNTDELDNVPGPGVWYVYAGDGSTVTFSTDNAGTDFDTRIGYTDGCGNAGIDFNEDGGDVFVSGYTSVLTFETAPGTNYYVYVGGYQGTATGSFEMTLTCATPPANDLCENAEVIECGDVVSGTTVGASNVGAATGIGEGVWYVLAGNDQLVTVGTCGSTSGYDTEIAVFYGDCDTRLDEVTDDDGCPATNYSTVTFAALGGLNYYVYVGNYSTFTTLTGDFDLAVTCAPLPAPDNDLCADAIALDCGDVVIGSTASATPTDEPVCTNGGRGVWYSFTGDGSDYTISLDGSTFDTYLALIDACGAGAACVASNDDIDFNAGNYTSEIQDFTTVDGQDYLIYVSSYDGSVFLDSGSFVLSLESISCAPPANDFCADAIPVVCGQTVSGTNAFGTAEAGLGTCTTDLSAGPGVWYSFVGTGEEVTVTTCNAGTDLDTKLGVFEGTCAGMTCIDGNDDDNSGEFGALCESTGVSGANRASTVNFYGEFGVDYMIYVTGFLANEGNFDLSVSCVCTADAGTLTADAATACLSGGTATISATHDGNSVVPTGYLQAYILVDALGNIVNMDAAASFEVSATGDYSIHTLVYDPLQFDPSTDLPVDPTVTDAITALGTQCYSADLAGAAVSVSQDPVADFSAAQTASTLDVAFTDASTDATSYMWDFGDGNTSAMQSPTHTYAADGDYTVCLIAINDCDLDGDTLCELITVNPLPPANDLCADAETVICGQTTSGTNVGGTADASLGGNCGTDLTAGPGVWYTFAGTGDFVTVTTCNIGTDFDTKLGVFSGDCNNLVCVAGNDDDTSGDFGTLCESTGVPGSNRASTVGFLSVQGTDYYFYVTGFLQEQGAFDLSVTCSVPPTAPANDDVCSPQALVMGANGPYSNELATADATDPILPDATDGCNGNDGWCFDTDVENSVWFTFEAPASGNIIVSANGSSFDTQLAVYEAVSCQDFATGTQVQLAANDDLAGAITFGNSEVYLCGLTPAATYFVLVDGYDGAEGDILVTLTETTVDADFTSVATGLSVAFTDASTGAVTYAWDFGDGNTSTDASPTNVYAADGSYTVCLTVTDANGCTSEYCEVIQVAGPVGIVETLEANLSIYPNPSNGQFVVEAKGVDSNAQITVLDMTGRQIYSEGVVLNGSFRKELNLNAAKGTYLLQVFTVEGLVTRKIQIH